MASGLLVYIQLWCTEEKGPVFVTMFNPLLTVLTALLSYFVVGDKLHLGWYVIEYKPLISSSLFLSF